MCNAKRKAINVLKINLKQDSKCINKIKVNTVLNTELAIHNTPQDVGPVDD